MEEVWRVGNSNSNNITDKFPRLRKMKGNFICLLLVAVMILLIGNVSALEFDNVKSYDTSTKTVTVTNAFGLGSNLATIKLERNTDYCIVNCEAEMTLDLKSEYANPFSKLDFYNKLNMRKVNLQENKMFIATSGHYEKTKTSVLDEASCKINEKGISECSSKIINIETWVWDYKPYNPSESLPAGTYHIKITGQKKASESIEWIPNYLGVEVDEWATWSAGLSVKLLANYNMSSGLSTYNGTNYDINISNFDGTMVYNSNGGFLGESANFTGTQIGFIRDEKGYFNLNSTTQKNTTIIFWVKPNDITLGRQTLIAKGLTADNDGWEIHKYPGNGKLQFEPMAFEHASYIWNEANLSNNNWTMITIIKVFNDTGGGGNFGTTCAQVNKSEYSATTCWNSSSTKDIQMANITIGGLKDLTNYFQGQIDELLIWNRTLSISEVNDIYNNGLGTLYFDIFSVNVSLNVPLEGASSFPGAITFNCSSFSRDNIENLTLVIDMINNVTITNGLTNASSLQTNVSGLNNSGHVWGCLSSTALNSNLNYGQNFTVSNIIEGGTYYKNITYPSRNYYEVNVSAGTAVTLGYFHYGGTAYAAQITNTSDIAYKINISRTVNDPASQTNNSLYFSFTLAGNNYNTTQFNQTVNPITFVRCDGVSYPVINFTFVDEELGTRMNATMDTATFTYQLPTASTYKTYTFTNNSLNTEYGICIAPNDTSPITISGTLYYSASEGGSTWPQRRSNIVNETFTNITTGKTLYLLNYNAGITSIYQVVTSGNIPISNAYIRVTRSIGGVDTFVSDGYTDGAGALSFFLNPSYEYIFTISKTGYTSLVQTIRPVSGTYTIVLGGSTNPFYYSSPTEGIVWTKWPPSGIIMSDSMYNFTFVVESRASNILNCSIDIKLANGSSVASAYGCNVSAPNTGGSISAMVNTSNKFLLIGRYTIGTLNGTILLEGDARWVMVNVSRSGGIGGSLKQGLQDFFSLPEWGGCPTGYTLNATDYYCYNALGEKMWRQTTDFSRIVFFFIVFAIIMAIVNFYTSYDTAYPGAFLLLFSGIVLLLSIVNGVGGPGFFYLAGASNPTFFYGFTPIIDNWMYPVHVILLTIIYFFTTQRRYQG